jgi:hypothetical protein
MPKKNNPGCNCCQGEDCATRCLYKCTGTPPCPFPCAIQIDTPTPDVVSKSTGATCPEADCDVSAECFQCRILFDGLFFLNAGVGASQREGWDGSGFTGPNCSDQTQEFTPNSNDNMTRFACWTYSNYLCPEDTYLWDFSQCVPEYSIVSPIVTVNVTYSAGCSTTEVLIEYKVRKSCDEVAIPPNPPTSPETTYTHTFRRTNQCNCDDILGALTYISTSSVNNSRGVTVPDVCNMDAATVSLVGNGSACGCECLTCLGVDNDLLLTVTGGDYPGTYLLTKDSEVFFSPDGAPGYSQCIFGSADFGSPAKNWFVVIDCRGCEVLDVRLFLRESPSDPVKYAESLAVACSDPLTLTTLVGDGTYEVS